MLGERGIQAAAYVRGELVLDAWAGTTGGEHDRPVDRDTLFNVFSVSKGIAVTALHILADRGLLKYDDRVVEYWPEYGVNGKEGTTIRDVLTHRSGAPQMPEGVTPELMCNWEWMVEQVAAAKPFFPPGTQSAYHSTVYGWQVGEIVHRIDPWHRDFNTFVQEEICAPLGINDIYFGVPDGELDRVAQLYTDMPIVVETDPVSVAAKPPQIPYAPEVYGRRDVQQACIAGAGGIMSARGAARVFAMLANGGEIDGVRLLSEELIWKLSEERDRPEQIDAVLAGGGKFPLTMTIGGYWSADLICGTSEHFLCHAGVGGSVGWANLDTGVAGAIAHNRMFERGVMDEGHPYLAIIEAIDNVTRAYA
jgi:CubicO group peptidase (beta-lactamase class C family)